MSGGVAPLVEGAHHLLLPHHIFALVVAVLLAVPELAVAPQLVGHLHAPVAALPDERSVGLTIVPEQLRRRIEVLLVPEDLRPPVAAQLVAAAVPVAEEARRPPFEVVERQAPPPLRVLQLHRQLGVLVLDQLLARVAAVHAHQPVEHQLQVAGRSIPMDRPDDRPGVGEVEPRVQIEVPHQVGLDAAVLLVAVAGPHAKRHRGRDTGVAALDLGPGVDIAEILVIDLPLLRQALGHAQHEGARLGVDAGTVVLAAARAGEDQNPEGPPGGRQVAVRVVGLHAAIV